MVVAVKHTSLPVGITMRVICSLQRSDLITSSEAVNPSGSVTLNWKPRTSKLLFIATATEVVPPGLTVSSLSGR